MSKLSESIISYRKTYALSQEAFGKMLNVSKQTVSKWESGNKSPSTKHIYEICHLLNISPEDILEHSDGKRKEEASPYIPKENHSYDVGLNHLFSKVIDFYSFSQFMDGYLAVRKVFGNKEDPIALLLLDLRFDDEMQRDPLPIMDIHIDEDCMELILPDKWDLDPLCIGPNAFPKVVGEAAYNNTTYAFTLYQNQTESSGHFLQIVLGLE